MSGKTTAPIVVKIGTNTLTRGDGTADRAAIDRVVQQVADLRAGGEQIVVVTSGAIAVGLQLLGIERPNDPVSLQAISSVGQVRLMQRWSESFADRDTEIGQVLLAPLDFMVRQQYLHARDTLGRLLELGIVPVVNENDAIADDEIRFGDNDRLAALVAHLIGARVLVLLTDTPGVLSGDPRLDPGATLIEEIRVVDAALEARTGGSTSGRGSGGMASKLAAAKIAAWTGIRTVIADGRRDGVVADAVADRTGVGTVVRPHDRRLSARKLWIAFAVGSSGRVHVDAGARRALVEKNRSLLPAGITKVEGDFTADQAVELLDPEGVVFAKGMVRVAARELAGMAGRRTTELGDVSEIVHRDDLVILPD